MKCGILSLQITALNELKANFIKKAFQNTRPLKHSLQP